VFSIADAEVERTIEADGADHLSDLDGCRRPLKMISDNAP